MDWLPVLWRAHSQLQELGLELHRLVEKQTAAEYTGHRAVAVSLPADAAGIVGNVLPEDARITRAGMAAGAPDAGHVQTTTHAFRRGVAVPARAVAGNSVIAGPIAATAAHITWTFQIHP